MKSENDKTEKAFRKYYKRLKQSAKATDKAEKALKKWYRLKGFLK